MKKYYKTVFQIEVLSEDPTPDSVSLADIEYNITEGHSSGVLKEVSRDMLSGKDMAMALQEQGSDPEFFGLDKDGNELDE